VTVPDAPVGALHGAVALHPAATTSAPGTRIAGFALVVDGRPMPDSGPIDGALWLNTPLLADGWHDLRVVATDDSPAAVQGEWRSTIEVRNRPERRVSMTADKTTGDLATLFRLHVIAAGGPDDVAELRLRQGARLLAAWQDGEASFDVDARLLGAGRPALVAEALYRDGGLSVSAPLALDIAPTMPDPPPEFPLTQPQAYSYILDVQRGQPMLLDLPALAGMSGAPELRMARQPMSSAVVQQGAFFLLKPNTDAVGADQLSFNARSDAGLSTGGVTLRYCEPPAITKQPEDVTGCSGTGSVVLEVTADGAIGYQWFRDGKPIPGAVSARYDAGGTISIGNSGSYEVVVYSRCGATWPTVRSRTAIVRGGDCPTPTPGPTKRPVYLPLAGTGR
jgi:hypothetical protein